MDDDELLNDETQDGSFTFAGEVLALDLVNTVVVVRGKRHDLLQTPDDLAQWWAIAQRHYPDRQQVEVSDPAFDTSLLDAVKALRDSLRRLLTGLIERNVPDMSDVDVLNQVLQTGHPALNLSSDTAPVLIYRSEHPTGILLPVALSALTLLTGSDLSRLHKCHNERCVLLFYDHTRSATRQWCSKACFERERAAGRYEQARRLKDKRG